MSMLGFRELRISGDDGTSLHGWIHDGVTAPVLLLHDLATDARYWTPFLEAALEREPGLAVAALDLRGHGGSALGTETSRKRMVKDLRRWVRGLDIDPPIVVGHGYGADIALTADFVAAVVAVNPALGRPTAPLPDDLTMPSEVTGAVDAHALQACSVGAANAKSIKRSRRDAPLFLVLAEPGDTDGDTVAVLRDVAEDTQTWAAASRHLPLENPAGLAALVLGWIAEVQ